MAEVKSQYEISVIALHGKAGYVGERYEHVYEKPLDAALTLSHEEARSLWNRLGRALNGKS